MANQFLALSLFIMLLSFFIVLNAYSNFEVTKSRPVMNSISLAFSNQDLPEETTAGIQEDEADYYKEGDALDRLEALFRSNMTGIKAQKNRLGTMMHIRLPADKFEEIFSDSAGTDQRSGFSGLSGPLVPTLVSLMNTEGEIQYRMDIILNMKENPSKVQNESPQVMDENIRRVALYAQKLEDAGLPKMFMTAGLGQGVPDTVDLYFHRYAPFNLQRAKTAQ